MLAVEYGLIIWICKTTAYL